MVTGRPTPRATPPTLSLPGPPLGAIARPRLVDRVDGPERVALVVAPPGYGKTEVARQWIDHAGTAATWLAVDLLDDTPRAFWSNLIRALRDVTGAIDDEPALLLEERGPGDPVFLDALVSQLERAGRPAAVVIDDLWRITDGSVFDGLALLVARVGHLVRFVIISRSDPPLPTASWRSRGWLAEVREEQLRFADDEALRVAAEFAGLELSADAVTALNASAEGWPIGLHLALLSLASEPEPESRARTLARTDRLLIDYLVAEVLDHLPPAQRYVALSLSVLTWFDPQLCAGLLGEDAVPAAAELRRRQLFLTTIDGSSGAMRFHPLFRNLLESELQWRYPARRQALHRRAAELWIERGDLAAAYGHLVAIGDVAAATELIVPLALDLVDRGDVVELARHMRSLPATVRVETARQAFDLSVAWFFAGDEDEAVRWSGRGEELGEPDDAAHRLRAHASWAAITLMQGAIDRSREHVEAFARAAAETDAGGPVGPIERRFATIAARVALLARRFDDAAPWVDSAGRLTQPSMVANVIAPMLRAWLELEVGDLRRAGALADGAVAHAQQAGARPHHGALDALVVAAHCRLATGRLREAEDLLELARADAAALGWTLPIVRSGLATAELARLRSRPQTALGVLEALRATVGARTSSEVDAWLAAAEAAALIGAGQFRTAEACLERVPDGPRARLLAARLVVSSRAGTSLATLLADRAGWAVAERLEAALLLAAADPEPARLDELRSALATGQETGWVAPFLGLGPVAEAGLARLPVAELHPDLAAALAAGSARQRDVAPRRLVEALTPRERTLLELLPTHLSYAQLGDELFLSVNTIKSNLKSIYRKLGVTSRSEAVDAATALGLLDAAAGAGLRAPAARPRRP